MKVDEVLSKAWASVEEANLPDHLHGIAFQEAVRLLTLEIQRPSAANGRGSTSHSDQDQSEALNDLDRIEVSEIEMYERITTQIGVERAQLEQIVYLDDNGPRINLGALKLGKNNADRARSVAQILTITRSIGLGENDTPLEIIRAECERLKVYDMPNFSRHMAKLNGYVINGEGQNKRLRARPTGVAAFPGLVDKLLSGS